jgi:hypothetical protein
MTAAERYPHERPARRDPAGGAERPTWHASCTLSAVATSPSMCRVIKQSNE